MTPVRKISETILGFGDAIFQCLPDDSSKSEFDESVRVVVCAWNAVVLDDWDKTDRNAIHSQAAYKEEKEKIR